MKLLLKTALLTATGAALVAQTASGANTFTQGDLLLAFRATGKNDLIVDIGAASAYLNASANINLDTIVAAQNNPSFSTLSSLIDNVFGSASGVTWSVAGALKPAAAVTELFITDPTDKTTAIAQANLTQAGGTFIGAYASLFASAGAGTTLVQNLAVDPTATTAGTYSLEHANVVGKTSFGYEAAIPVSGTSSQDFFTFTPGAAGTLGNGSFSIDSSGNGEFIVQTPEPTTCSLIGAAGVMAVLFRRRFSK